MSKVFKQNNSTNSFFKIFFINKQNNNLTEVREKGNFKINLKSQKWNIVITRQYISGAKEKGKKGRK